jgi:hypothetical protein
LVAAGGAKESLAAAAAGGAAGERAHAQDKVLHGLVLGAMGKLLGGSLGTGEAREGKFGGRGHGGAVRRSGAAGMA